MYTTVAISLTSLVVLGHCHHCDSLIFQVISLDWSKRDILFYFIYEQFCFCPISAVCVDLAKVCGVDLRDASHEQAVEAIRRAGDSVVFVVQSGQHRPQVLHLRKRKRKKLLLV